ncbi:MAG TPA: DUF4124 domain-containing protein [Burkholderiales bacterium]|nr:DUF4124 domain-containing protein [Burkholderiales bacterium]
MIRFAFFTLALIAAAGVQAQVYKCADASGNISYSQRPCPANMKREPMSRGAIPRAPAAHSDEGAADKAAKGEAGKNAPKTPAQQEQAFRQRLQDQAKAEKDAAQKAAEAKRKEENCRNSKQRLAQYEIGGRITRINEQGERYYMDDAQIESEKARASADVSQFCN